MRRVPEEQHSAPDRVAGVHVNRHAASAFLFLCEAALAIDVRVSQLDPSVRFPPTTATITAMISMRSLIGMLSSESTRNGL
jgi:hypothetical protein